MDKPSRISVAEKYSILGKLTDTQRIIVSVIIKMSADGKWARYTDFNVTCPEKRMSEIMLIKGIKIKRRVASEMSDGRLTHLCEFCV